MNLIIRDLYYITYIKNNNLLINENKLMNENKLIKQNKLINENKIEIIKENKTFRKKIYELLNLFHYLIQNHEYDIYSTLMLF
jgi:hypothetical protein